MFFSTPSWKLWSELRMPRGKLWSSLFIISTSSFGCLLFNKDLWLPQFLMLFTMPWEDAGERKRKSISIRQIHLWNFARKKKFSTLKKKKIGTTAQPIFSLSFCDLFIFCPAWLYTSEPSSSTVAKTSYRERWCLAESIWTFIWFIVIN